MSPHQVQALIEEGLSVHEIAKRLGCSDRTMQRRFKEWNLKTLRVHYRNESKGDKFETRLCKVHGSTIFRLASPMTRRYRCVKCSSAYVQAQREKNKQILVEELGGQCAKCAYSQFLGALQFHHLDPQQKSFTLGDKNMASSLSVLRAEAEKCILLCANCHVEVEYKYKNIVIDKHLLARWQRG